MNICIIGAGYVGLVTGACLAEYGHNVICLDIDENKIENLKRVIIPIYEPGLENLIYKNQSAGRLKFTSDYKTAVENSKVIFIAVGTPDKGNGSADLRYVIDSINNIMEHINDYKIIVTKSTVPVGTGAMIKEIISSELDRRQCAHTLDVVSNPEFLREGTAINDFIEPDRIIIGCDSVGAQLIMEEIYDVPRNNGYPFVVTGIESAELIKYASNVFLAVKISFINEISVLCENVGADVRHISYGMGLDKRIGEHFFKPGPGYGGSCFPKDTRALINTANTVGIDMSIVKAAVMVNETQKLRMVKKLEKQIGNIKEKTIAILGLAFKPGTDDIRESPAVAIIEYLREAGALIRAYDPVAMDNARSFIFPENNIQYCSDEYDAVTGADAIMLITEWSQFCNLDFIRIKALMRGNIFFDCRNVYPPDSVRQSGLFYIGIGC